MVADVFMVDNLATIIESGKLYVFHNRRFHVGQLYQTETRVDTRNCAIVELDVVSRREEVSVEYSRFSLDRTDGTVLVISLCTGEGLENFETLVLPVYQK